MKIFKFFSLVAISIAIAAPLSNDVSASVPQFTLQPVAASTDFRARPEDALNTIDQSGLGPRYTSLVSNFDEYIASRPTASHGFGVHIWLGPSTMGNFDFDLGDTYTITAMALWNLGAGVSTSLREFNLLVDDNPSFSSPRSVGSFIASNDLGTDRESEAQVITFAPTTAAFVRLEILNSWGNPVAVGFNEVMFATPVPEPETYAMLLAGLGLLGLITRRRKNPSM